MSNKVIIMKCTFPKSKECSWYSNLIGKVIELSGVADKRFWKTKKGLLLKEDVEVI